MTDPTPIAATVTVVEPPAKPTSPPEKPDSALPQSPRQASELFDDKTRWWIALFTMAGTFGYIYGITFWPVQLDKTTMGTILGGVIIWNGIVLTWYFGSSSGSKVKGMDGK